MFTSMDKALAALIMGALYIVNTAFGFHFGISEQTVSTIVGVLTPIIVYMTPNKKVA